MTTPSVLNWKTDYTYYSPGTGLTSNVIGSMTHNPIGLTISYQYDNRGYISKMLENGVEQAAYTYDAAEQLVRENNKKLNKTICYEYDNGGNLLWKKEYAYTTGALGDATKTYSYGYADTVWKDKLTSYNGESITYDAIGNPLTYLNGLRFTWTGRQLTGISYNLIPGSYSYNADGIRTKKVINGTVTEYYLEGSRILGQKTGEQEQWYHYDSDGSRVGIQYKGENYYYYYNAQGDVLGLFDKPLNKVVEYVYDSWGKIESIIGTLASSLGQANPFRYRGYYYDSESGLYYLNSRYYDPETGRFLNADEGVYESALGSNLFAYCENIPVVYSDPSGKGLTEVMFLGIIFLAAVVSPTITAAAIPYLEDFGIAMNNLINTAVSGAQALTQSYINDYTKKIGEARDGYTVSYLSTVLRNAWP